MWPAPIWTVEVHGDGAALADPAAVVGELGPDLVGAGRSGCWVATLVRSRLNKL
jgi:hypothetical protein